MSSPGILRTTTPPAPPCLSSPLCLGRGGGLIPSTPTTVPRVPQDPRFAPAGTSRGRGPLLGPAREPRPAAAPQALGRPRQRPHRRRRGAGEGCRAPRPCSRPGPPAARPAGGAVAKAAAAGPAGGSVPAAGHGPGEPAGGERRGPALPAGTAARFFARLRGRPEFTCVSPFLTKPRDPEGRWGIPEEAGQSRGAARWAVFSKTWQTVASSCHIFPYIKNTNKTKSRVIFH